MTSSITRSISQLIRRQATTASAQLIPRQPSTATIQQQRRITTSIFHQLLTPPAPRFTGSTFSEFEDVLGNRRISNKQVRAESSLILQGFEASKIKTLLPLVQQHLSHVEAQKAVFKNLTTQTMGGGVRVSCIAEVKLHGYDASEVETIRPCAEQFTTIPDDEYENPKGFMPVIRGELRLPEMTPSISQSIDMVIRRLSDRMATSLFHRLLMGATDSEFEEALSKRQSNKKVKIDAHLILDGLEAFTIKALLPLVLQHLNHDEARNVVYKNLTEGLDKHACVGYCTKVTLDGYKAPEMDTLRSACTTVYNVPTAVYNVPHEDPKGLV